MDIYRIDPHEGFDSSQLGGITNTGSHVLHASGGASNWAATCTGISTLSMTHPQDADTVEILNNLTGIVSIESASLAAGKGIDSYNQRGAGQLSGESGASWICCSGSHPLAMIAHFTPAMYRPLCTTFPYISPAIVIHPAI